MTGLTPNMGNYRYRILALVFMATTINYFDRSIIGVMAPTLQKLFEWSNKDYAAIMVSFKIAYGMYLKSRYNFNPNRFSIDFSNEELTIYSLVVYSNAFKKDIKLAIAIFYKDGNETVRK